MLNAVSTRGLNAVDKRKAADVFPFLEAYIAKREHQIAEIMQMVERYEKKRMMEERAYQAMSPLRRMLSGKKPDHHIAVEYIHYVRKPMEQVKLMRHEIESARVLLEESLPQDMIKLSDEMVKEME
jgi:Ser/Thr protein kinase RdoA (MazF antagonist)